VRRLGVAVVTAERYVEVVTGPAPAAPIPDIREARRLFPSTEDRVYLNTAAVGLASQRLADTYHAIVDEWLAEGFNYHRGERAAEDARSAVARLVGASDSDIALILSVWVGANRPAGNQSEHDREHPTR
jgi:selenocysteine lyase/cysteine desulfurase